MQRLDARCTDLLVVECRGEREHPGARVQREHVVRPVGDEGVADLAVGPLGVGVRRYDLADAITPRHVLRHVERVGRALEGRRVVVRIGDLETIFQTFYFSMLRHTRARAHRDVTR